MARPSDIIVIGAGIVGCAVAHELASRGASVEIVDERPVGMGATQASAGVLAPYIEARDGSPLLELTVRSLGLFDDFMERVAAESGIAVSYRRTGTLDVAVNDVELHALRATAEVLARRDVPALLLDAQAARAEEPELLEGVIGGLLIESHGFVGAGELTRALAAAARRRGAQLIERSKVRRITRQNGDVVVDTNRGTLTSNAVVLSAGSWSGDIAVEGLTATVPVRPVRGQLLHLGWTGTPLRRVTWSGRCYLVTLGGWDAAGGRDRRRSRLRRADDGGWSSRAARRRLRDSSARLDGWIPRSPRGTPPGDRRRSSGHRPVSGGAEPDVCDRSLSQRCAAGAADGATGRRRDARQQNRPAARAGEPVAFRRAVMAYRQFLLDPPGDR